METSRADGAAHNGAGSRDDTGGTRAAGSRDDTGGIGGAGSRDDTGGTGGAAATEGRIDPELMRLAAGAFAGLPRESVPDASSVTRIMQQVGGSFGTAVLAVILAGHSFQVTFWWSVGFTVLALLPALMLPARRAAAREQGRSSQKAGAPGS